MPPSGIIGAVDGGTMRTVAIVGVVATASVLLAGCAKDIRAGGEMSQGLTDQVKNASSIVQCGIDDGGNYAAEVKIVNPTDRPANVSLVTVQFYDGDSIVGNANYFINPLPPGKSASKIISALGTTATVDPTCQWGQFTVLFK